MALIKKQLTASFTDDVGNAVSEAIVTARLTRPDQDNGEHISPTTQTWRADANGDVTLELWPNTRGESDSAYHIRARDPETGLYVYDRVVVMPDMDTTLDAITDLSHDATMPIEGWQAVKAAREYRDTADNHATTAQRYASESEDTTVVDEASGADTGTFSSKHHRNKSEQAQAASESARDASQSARDAAQAARDDSDEHATTSERWATETGTTVVDADSGVDSGEYGAKEYAQGDLEGHGGSSKAWATDSQSPDGSGEKSAKTLAGEASTSASNAATSESNAAISETNAADSASAAATSESNAQSHLDTFQGQYWGAFSGEPSTDANGNGPDEGDLYFNTTDGEMKVYDAAAPAWKTAALDSTKFLQGANNLSDVGNAGSARSNIGLGSAATKDTGTASARVPTNADIDGRGFAAQVDSVSDLQSGSYPASLDRIWLSGYYGVGTPGGGPLYRDSADTTTADNGGTVFVDADGVRWKRQIVPENAVITVEMFGGASDNSRLNAAIANDVVAYLGSIGGGRLSFSEPGTYLLEQTGASDGNGNKRCLEIRENNIEVYVGPGVTLKLADGEQNDTDGSVDLITFIDTDGSYVRGAGRGVSTITGNTAGQTNWTGGYAQRFNGEIVVGVGTSGNGIKNFAVEDISLIDHFSNPVDTIGSTADNSDCYIRRIYFQDVGEGPLFKGVTRCGMWDVIHIDVAGVSVGDPFEYADCLHVQHHDVYAKDVSTGSGTDFAECRDVQASNLEFDGCQEALGFGNSGVTGATTDRVHIRGVIARNLTGTNVVNAAGVIPTGTVHIDGLSCYNSGIIAQINGTASAGAFKITNIYSDGCKEILVNTNRVVVVDGFELLNGTNHAFNIRRLDTESNAPEVYIRNGRTAGTAGNELNFNQNGTMTVTGRIQNVDFGSDAIGGAGAGNVDISGLVARDLQPAKSSAGPGAGVALVSEFYEASSDFATVSNPTKQKKVTIVATASLVALDHSNASGVNLHLAGGSNFSMGADDTLTLMYDDQNDRWLEIGRSA